MDGVRAYDAARKGEPLELTPVEVDVHSWTIREARDGEIDVTIECGTGTYIRSLARDLGRATSSAAHLSSLRRTRSGDFHVEHAVSVDALKVMPPGLTPLRVVAGD